MKETLEFWDKKQIPSINYEVLLDKVMSLENDIHILAKGLEDYKKTNECLFNFFKQIKF